MADEKVEVITAIEMYLCREGIQVAESKTITNTTSDIYVVPQGMVFLIYLISARLTNSSGAGATGSVYLTGPGNSVDAAPINLYLVGDGVIADVLSFTMPIRLAAGKKVRGYASGASRVVNAFIHGYLLPEDKI